MRHATAGVLPAFCAAFAASVAAAQSPPASGHSTAMEQPRRVNLAGEEPGDLAETLSQPTRMAQYPLENDPYEKAPDFRAATQPERAPAMAGPTPGSALQVDEEKAWLTWDETRLSGSYLHDSPDGLGIIDVVASAKIKTGLPGVSIGPQVGVHFLGSGGLPNVPEHLYDFSNEWSAGMPIGDDWILMGAVSPGVFSDLSGNSGDSFRIPARLLAFYKWSDALTVAGGIIYLDRKDISVIPAVGLTYKPNDRFNADLWFPRPKLSWRYLKRPDLERWVYLVGELGGGSWGIERDDGGKDIFTYRDYRAMVGFEQRQDQGFNWYTEAGLIFNRSYELDRAGIDENLDNTAAMQFGVRF